MEAHKAAVSAISSQVSTFHQRNVPFRLYHGATNSTQSRTVDRARMLDTSRLSHVLAVNQARKTCLVEPNVPMDRLVDAVLPFGLVPEVVMEFPGITVGGGFSGTAGESSGFKSGFFEDTVNWIEIVLGDGEVVRASPHDGGGGDDDDEHRSDLFWGAAGSFGTLGVITLLELRLVEAKRFVELTYHPTTTPADALATLRRACETAGNDYVDGILFAPDRGVVVTGRLTDEPAVGVKVQRFSRAHDPWFYIHAERTIGRDLEPVTEATPLRDYLFRYDRGAFFTGKYAFQYFLTPFNRITRYALDYFMHTRVMYHALHASGHASKYMIQDLLLPSATAEPFIDFVSRNLNFWPLWLCPFTVHRELSLHPRLPANNTKESEKPRTFVNVGVWGPGSTDYARFVEQNRQLERKVRELGGIKWLYAQAYYTEAEFTDIYDRQWYDELRERYHATYLPTVYDKVKVDLTKADAYPATWSDWLRRQAWSTWPVSGVYGVLKVLYEREY
ncbi:hypothetical protein LTR36_005357 [Oleoguttula mirabilis]|uniref:Delta(24)-sterol reductase n=1 Tax=Oleoguttula mirabilis TaxID=1507867 RepID=A0AAV9JEJ2_9PEZI|nr:hypothetical protein LTR36_005357 [Oleoguttula mirabilis]